MHDSLGRLLRIVRRGLILLVGVAVLIAGVMMVVLPGPAVVVIPLGLAILSLEFAWARRWLDRVRSAVRRPAASADGRSAGVNASTAARCDHPPGSPR
jgi:uncharacterized protein (TIGR02611 family)